MTRKETEEIRALGVVLRAAYRQMERLPCERMKGRVEGLRTVALEAQESVEQSLAECAEAYLEERFNIRYGSTLVAVRLHGQEGEESFQARILRCIFAGDSDDPKQEAMTDQLIFNAELHKPGHDDDGERIQFQFEGAVGDQMEAIGNVEEE